MSTLFHSCLSLFTVGLAAAWAECVPEPTLQHKIDTELIKAECPEYVPTVQDKLKGRELLAELQQTAKMLDERSLSGALPRHQVLHIQDRLCEKMLRLFRLTNDTHGMEEVNAIYLPVLRELSRLRLESVVPKVD